MREDGRENILSVCKTIKNRCIMNLVAGIDVSKDDFHVCLKERTSEGKVKIKRSHSFRNDYEGYREFLQWSTKDRGSSPVRYVMEATGTYYEDLAYYLHDHHGEVCVVLANKIKHYAKSLNIKTKTDKVDARVIADFGMERAHPLWEPMSDAYRQLRDLCRELLSMKKELCRVKCQLHAMNHAHEKNTRVLSVKSKQIDFYENMIKEIESEIRRLVEQDGALKERVDKITTVKGLGLMTVVIVLCETNGFQLFNNIRQVVSYAGLDVEMKESGKFKGRSKLSKKGNARIRQSLFMPALSATNYNKNIKAFYKRVVEKNPDAKRKGIVAGMRKLLILIFVLWKKNETYNENHQWGKNPVAG
jgi:transposase